MTRDVAAIAGIHPLSGVLSSLGHSVLVDNVPRSIFLLPFSDDATRKLRALVF
ncbi:MAG: hypothetical protein HC856_02085 [Pseudanabaena sp. RU_4_16]|nr:hypothetical protein [Pseudanabaena sp. RU_4_16]